MPREAHIVRQIQWKNKLSEYGCRVTLEKTVYIGNAPVIVDVHARAEGKTYLIEIGDISDKRKIELMKLYAKQNPNIEFIHEPYNTDKIGKVLDELAAYRNSDEFRQIQIAKMEDKRRRKRNQNILVALILFSIIVIGLILYYPAPETQNQTLDQEVPSETQNQTPDMPSQTQNQTSNQNNSADSLPHDASVALNFPDQNYGSDDELIVAYWPQSSVPSDEIPAARRNTYLKFDLSNISNQTIISATLKLFCSSVGYEGSTVGVYLSLDNSWNEGTINGNNAPPYVSPASDTVLVMENNTWYSLDVTSDVVASLDIGVITEVLRIENTAGINHDIRFWSKEYSNEQYHPRLEVTVAPE